MAGALNNEQWLIDLQHGNMMEIAVDFLRLWRLLQHAQTNGNEADKIRWIEGRQSSYTAGATYKM